MDLLRALKIFGGQPPPGKVRLPDLIEYDSDVYRKVMIHYWFWMACTTGQIRGSAHESTLANMLNVWPTDAAPKLAMIDRRMS